MTVANSVLRIVEETLPLIIIFAVLELFTGGFLGNVVHQASKMPGLLILVPGLLGLRGNISSALGARIASGLHLGSIEPNKISSGLKTNIAVSITLSIMLSLILSVLAWGVCSYSGGACMGLLNFVLVAVLTGFMSAIVLSFSTAGIAIMSYRKGLDPCNTTLPASASLGDIVTIIFLIVSVKIVMGLGI